ncbi:MULTISPECIES: bifunctional riboflavin kinase/FAD synthetase [unclassified Neochlamydia]|uniref:bifunctional riboflavin kinase/FAD synthetase n=1 Tax=unclassified Neochlamydia TaxID=2643326 RepID=UPI00140B7342|nr:MULTISPECIES: bifunctional riboflavin kinase/FAD synthetase [unclassified Neochlamydia]
MKLLRELPATPLFSTSSVLTLGNFDGMHIGHQAIIKKVVETAKSQQKASVVLSFENHPSEVLYPDRPVNKICTNEHKIQLIKNMGVDLLILLKFTKEFSEQSAEQFIHHLQTLLPFSHLILGWDATLGKDRKGNKETIKGIAEREHFGVEYIEQQTVDEVAVSSSLIRKFIQEGQLETAQKLLGRPYSVLSAVDRGLGKGKQLSCPTANLDVKNLCIPPLGVYAVNIFVDQQLFKGVANLGIAPTVREDKVPLLEAHIFDYEANLYGKTIEVILTSYLRPEKKFANLEELKLHIQQDILKARSLG